MLRPGRPEPARHESCASTFQEPSPRCRAASQVMVLRHGWAGFLVKVIWARSLPGWAEVSPPPPGWSPPSVASLGLCVATSATRTARTASTRSDTSHAPIEAARARHGAVRRPVPRWRHVLRASRGVPDVALAPALRDALAAATYTYDAVGDLLGTTAQLALARNETTPALRRTTGGSPLETLVRLFLLQTEVDRAARRPGPPRARRRARRRRHARRLRRRGARPASTVGPYADDDHDWWVVSDLTPGLDGQPIRVAPDHVLGVSPASTSLAQLTAARAGRAARSTSAPAAASRRSTSPATPTRSSPPT